MIKLKDIIKEGVIEPLLEAETYKLKKKDGGKVVVFTNKDNYKKALKSGDYEEPEGKGGEEEKGKEDPGKLSGSDFDRQADKDDKPKEEPKESALDKIPSGDDAYKRTMEMSSEELESLAKELKEEHDEVAEEVHKQVDTLNKIEPRPMALNQGSITLGLLPREQQPDKEAYDKYVEEKKKLDDLKEKRERLKSGEKRMLLFKDDVIEAEDLKKTLTKLEKDENETQVLDRMFSSGGDYFYIEDEKGNEHEVLYDELSPEMQKKVKDELSNRIEKAAEAAKAYEEADLEKDEEDYKKKQQAFYDTLEYNNGENTMSTYDMKRMAKDMGLEIPEKQREALDGY